MKIIELIFDWYLSEWNRSNDKTLKRQKPFSENGSQFHVLMTLDSVPISTGGLYKHVSLLDKEQDLKFIKIGWRLFVQHQANNIRASEL